MNTNKRTFFFCLFASAARREKINHETMFTRALKLSCCCCCCWTHLCVCVRKSLFWIWNWIKKKFIFVVVVHQFIYLYFFFNFNFFLFFCVCLCACKIKPYILKRNYIGDQLNKWPFSFCCRCCLWNFFLLSLVESSFHYLL